MMVVTPIFVFRLLANTFVIITDWYFCPFQIAQAELASLISSMTQVDTLDASGINLVGEKYM